MVCCPHESVSTGLRKGELKKPPATTCAAMLIDITINVCPSDSNYR